MDVFGGGNLPDDGAGGAVPVEVVFIGGGGGAVPSEVVSLGGDGELRAVPIKVVCFGGWGGFSCFMAASLATCNDNGGSC